MELYLLRHGEAEPPGPGGDAARALTATGRDDVRRAALLLAQAGAAPDAIYVSPFDRARQTGDIAGRVLGVQVTVAEEMAPGATLDGLRAVLSGHEHRQVLLIGHEPDLSAMVRQLTGGLIRLRPGGLARVDATSLQPGGGRLVWLLSPEIVP